MRLEEKRGPSRIAGPSAIIMWGTGGRFIGFVVRIAIVIIISADKSIHSSYDAAYMLWSC